MRSQPLVEDLDFLTLEVINLWSPGAVDPKGRMHQDQDWSLLVHTPGG